VAPHASSVEETCRRLVTHPQRGLSDSRAAELIKRLGYNELEEKPPEPWWKRLGRQFHDLTIYVLIGAAIISLIFGEWVDTLAILAIVVLNGLLGFLQEDRAGRALAALQKLTSPHSRVIRDGDLKDILSRELAPGDRIELEAGDLVPADVRLVQSAGLRVLEAALTGESVPVEKDHRAILDVNTPLAERINMAYKGTAVSAGTGGGIVVATGMRTQLGQIAGLLDQYQNEPTPLQKRLTHLGKTLIIAVGVITTIIFVIQLARGGKPVDVFLLSITLAVAAAPEGLPAVITIALALGLQRLARRNALIRRLPSVETLGSVTVICSDKTGTLTRNEMTVREIVVGEQHFDVTGGGYVPAGEFIKRGGRAEDGQSPPISPPGDPDLLQALTIAAWCNHAHVAETEAKGTWKAVGDPTEAALVVAALKAEIPTANSAHDYIAELPFDADRKAMSVLARTPAGTMIMTKGAPESILAMCTSEQRDGATYPLTPDRRQHWNSVNADMASRALRVLALAYKRVEDNHDQSIREAELVFAGLVGMIDPPRDEAKVAVGKCHTAGIRPVMITGDHPQTGLAIARELGIAEAASTALSGVELEAMPDESLATRVEQISVYARVSPEHKLRIVRALKSQNHIVAMTGDGVNDAPAVKAADIGIAMGITGTDVTKQVADMVLADDNFSSIVAAVEEGRGIFDNIQKFVHYLLSSNASEILLMFFATLVGWPAPLVAIQILWINLVTDSLPALALGMEPTEEGVMSRPPRPAHEAIISLRRGLLMLWHGTLIATAAGLAFVLIYRGNEANLPLARTATFCTLAMAQLFFAFSCRSDTKTLPRLGFFSNPHLLGAVVLGCAVQVTLMLLPPTRHLLKTTPLTAGVWLLVFILALIPVTCVEVSKLLGPLVAKAPQSLS
jgi:Ca2+-transporting ATPase